MNTNQIIEAIKAGYIDANAFKTGDPFIRSHDAAIKRGYSGLTRAIYTATYVQVLDDRNGEFDGPYKGPMKVKSIDPPLPELVLDDRQPLSV